MGRLIMKTDHVLSVDKIAPKKLIKALTNLGTILEVHLQLSDIFRQLGIANSEPIMCILQLGAQPWE